MNCRGVYTSEVGGASCIRVKLCRRKLMLLVGWEKSYNQDVEC